MADVCSSHQHATTATSSCLHWDRDRSGKLRSLVVRGGIRGHLNDEWATEVHGPPDSVVLDSIPIVRVEYIEADTVSLCVDDIKKQ